MEITKENRIEMLLKPIALRWYQENRRMAIRDEDLSIIDDMDESIFNALDTEEEWNSN